VMILSEVERERGCASPFWQIVDVQDLAHILDMPGLFSLSSLCGLNNEGYR